MAEGLSRGSVFAGYRIEAEVGRGGMGVVYRATDLQLERPVALKLIAPELAHDEEFRKRFLRESKLAASLGHPHVLPVHGAGEEEGQLYLAMRYVEGEDLKMLLAREGRLELARTLQVCEQIAEALDAAHAKGLVHRDVKPANVLLDERGQAYLSDFGLTKQLGGGSTDSGQLEGTLDYLAPEQIRGEEVDGGTDEYALACLIYECLTGSPPFHRETEAETLWAHMQEAPPSVPNQPQLDPVLERALAKDPEERYPSCGDLHDSLREALGLETPRLRRRRLIRRGRALVVAGVLVLAAAAAAAAVELTGASGAKAAQVAGAAALDPRSGKILETVDIGSAPSSVAVGDGNVWVIDADDRTVSQIDAETRKLVRTFSTAATPTDVAVGAGSVWIGNAPSTGSPLPTSIERRDPETGLVDHTIDLGAPPSGHLSVFTSFSLQHIAAAEDAVWVINPDLTVSRIDPRTNRIVARIEDVRAENIAVGDGEVWLTEGDRLAEIDPSANAVARRVRLGVKPLAGLAVGAGAVWVADPQGGKLWRVDTGPSAARRAVPLETWVAGVSFGEGAVWVTNEIADAVHRVDPRTAEPQQVTEAPSPRAIDAGDGGVWLTAASPPSKDGALPTSVCRDVYYGREGRPDVLIVSSLPLQGIGRQWGQPMVDAIRHVLDQRNFEAGAFSVGYQSCDSSAAQAGAEDFFKCAFIAKAFARSLRVVGIFGSYTSPCSYPQIPIANEAPAGSLAMISPSNTADDLTADGDLYPTGTRNYFRLATAERYHGFAQVELARQLGHRRLFLLTSRGNEYVPLFPEGMRAYAKRVGVQIVGDASFDPNAETFDRLVREVARSRPDAVAVVGLLTRETGALIRELRAALGRGVSLSAPDDFSDPEALRKVAGAAAEGLYVSSPGIPNSLLPPRGKAFLESFASERGGDRGPDFAATYGAQGAEILLDAIARSDGTRASVTDGVRRTQVRNGILGDVAFDAKGDLVQRPMTILRFTRGDFVVDRVVRVRPTASPQ